MLFFSWSGIAYLFLKISLLMLLSLSFSLFWFQLNFVFDKWQLRQNKMHCYTQKKTVTSWKMFRNFLAFFILILRSRLIRLHSFLRENEIFSTAKECEKIFAIPSCAITMVVDNSCSFFVIRV